MGQKCCSGKCYDSNTVCCGDGACKEGQKCQGGKCYDSNAVTIPTTVQLSIPKAENVVPVHYDSTSNTIIVPTTAHLSIPEAENGYRIVPIQYDSTSGQLRFRFNLIPYDYINSNQDIIVYITIFDGTNTPRTVQKDIGTRADRTVEYSENIGYNVIAVQMSSSIGNSPRWDISKKPLPKGYLAMAQSKTRETFYVLSEYGNCKDSGACAKTLTVSADTYNAIKDRRSDYGFDNAKEILLVTSYETVFSNN